MSEQNKCLHSNARFDGTSDMVACYDCGKRWKPLELFNDAKQLRAEVEELKAKLPHNGEPCYGPGCHRCQAEQSDQDHMEAAQAGE